jgi:hypothetical protein
MSETTGEPEQRAGEPSPGASTPPDDDEQGVPRAPSDPADPPADPSEPLNPA